MKRSMQRVERGGFTLVELLVVIAIIAILIALLMPTVEYARFQAKCSHCMANMRNWGNATNLYAADHDGSLPRFNFYGGASGTTWDRGGDFWPDGLAEYGILPSMYFCPLDMTPRGRNQVMGRHGARDWSLHWSYVYWIGRTGPAYAGFRPRVDATGDNQLERCAVHYGDPKHLPVMTDGVFGGFGGLGLQLGNVNITPNDDQPNGHWYGGKLDNVNVLFLDGRVEVRKRDQIRHRYADPGWGPLGVWW